MQNGSRVRYSAIAVVAVALLLSACFAEQTAVVERVAFPGFWKGLWHGIIAPIAFLVSLFSDHVRVYAVPNAGRWYDFGFMIGIGGFTHGASRGARRRRPKRSREES
jgi:hypothetical protein